MAHKSVVFELESFREYLRSDSNEDAKTPMLYPLFRKFFGEKFTIWKVDKLPETAVIFHHTAEAQKAQDVVGKENARRTANSLKNEIKESAFYCLEKKYTVCL